MRQPGVNERLTYFWVAIYGLTAVLAARLVHVQVVRNVYYAQVAEQNATKIIARAAPRGRIYDRNGRLIAGNQVAFSLIYLPTIPDSRVICGILRWKAE